MESVQTAFGPLVSPGWPTTMGEQPDFAKSLLGGFAMAATLKGKQAQLQNQMAQYALKMQAMDHDMANDKIRNEIAVQRLVNTTENQRQRLELAKDTAEAVGERSKAREERLWAAEDRLQSVVDTKEKDKAQGEEASFNLNMLPQRMADEGIETGTETWYNQARDRSAKDLSQLPPQLRKAAESNLYRKYKDDRDFKLKQLESDERAFAHQYGRAVTGDDLNIDTYPMDHPEQLPDEKKGGYLGSFLPSLGGKPTGNKLIKGKDGEDRPIAVQRLNEFKKKYESLIKRRENMGPKVVRPDLGLYDIDDNKKTVRVIAPDGTHGSLPADAVSDYVNNRGYQLEDSGQ
jgi:hypothetical protein